MRSVALSLPKAIFALMLGLAAALSSFFLTAPELWPASLGLALPLAWAAMVDIDRLILPDVITLPLIGIGLAYAAAFDLPALLDAIAGAVAGHAALTLVALACRRLRSRDGLGHGDAKLLAAGGRG